MKALIARWLLPLVLMFTGPLAKAQYDIESYWEDYDYDAFDTSYWLEDETGYPAGEGADYDLYDEESWYADWYYSPYDTGPLDVTRGRDAEAMPDYLRRYDYGAFEMNEWADDDFGYQDRDFSRVSPAVDEPWFETWARERAPSERPRRGAGE